MKKIKRTPRIVWRFWLFAGWTVYYALRMMFGDKERGGAFARLWGRKIVKAVNMKTHFEGKPSKKGKFFVFNHLSYIDIPFLFSCLDGTFVAKKEVRYWPVIGYAAYKAGVVFIDRKNKNDIKRVNDLIDKTLNSGKNIFVFAEGTSHNGKEILPYKSSLLNVAAQRGEAVRYGVIGYKVPPGEIDASDSVCWWGDKGFFSHLMGLLALPSFDGKVYLADDEVFNEDRKELTNELWRKSVELHKKEIA